MSLEMDSLKQQAAAWEMVCQTLDIVAPGWTRGFGTGVQQACNAIAALAVGERPSVHAASVADKLPEPFSRFKHEFGQPLFSIDQMRNYGAAREAAGRAAARAATPQPATQAPAPVYVASRASVPERPAMWRALRSQGWPIISTWIDEAGPGETADFCDLWLRILAEIRASCGVILYAEASDFPLKGAFVEVGAALGMGKHVAVVLPGVAVEGDSMRPVGSWLKHPLVSRHDTVEEARAALSQQPARDKPTGFVDCGECPRISTGCPAGGCLKAQQPAREAVALTADQIDAVFDSYQDAPTMSFRYLVTRAVIRAFCHANGLQEPKA